MNAKAWFYSQSFNGRLDAGQSRPHKIVNIRNGNLVDRFKSRQDAEKWLASYGVSQEYKDINYRIVEG